MGESTSDYLVFHINPYVAVVLGTIGLLVSVAIQVVTPRYQAPVYWFAVVMIAVFGTMVADVLHVVVGVPYALSTFVLSLPWPRPSSPDTGSKERSRSTRS